jgi:hypothetical protein
MESIDMSSRSGSDDASTGTHQSHLQSVSSRPMSSKKHRLFAAKELDKEIKAGEEIKEIKRTSSEFVTSVLNLHMNNFMDAKATPTTSPHSSAK